MYLTSFYNAATEVIDTSSSKIADSYGFFYLYTPYIFQNDEQNKHGRANDILIIPPHTSITIKPSRENNTIKYDYFFCRLTAEELELFNSFSLPMLFPFNTKMGNHIYMFLNNIKRETYSHEITSIIKIDSFFKIFLVDLYREYRAIKKKSSSFEILSKAHSKILTELDKPWTLKSMASLTKYSVTRFSELYNQYYGISPKAQLTHHRIGFAQILLSTTNLPISEVATRCGFNDPFFFSKLFTKKVGISPSAYRKQEKT